MKHIFRLIPVFLITILFSSCNKGGAKRISSAAVIEFDTLKHDFGDLPFRGNADYEFVFTNTGTDPLLVTHVRSTCGCTIPSWSREPVKTGEKGTIRVSYDTGREGSFTKSIYVYSNAENGAQKLLITGTVGSSDT